MSSCSKGWLITAALIASGGLLLAPAVAAVSGVTLNTNSVMSVHNLNRFTQANPNPQLAPPLTGKTNRVDLRGLTLPPRIGSESVSKAITVAVHERPLDISRNLRVVKVERAAVVSPSRAPLAVTPLRYSLGSSVGWKGFAMPARMAEVDRVMAPKPKDRAGTAPVKPSRWNGAMEVESAPDVAHVTKGLERSKNVELDVSGSYSITRNLDVKAGVRYKADRDRVELLENQKDSQAVYVGTAFRF